MTANTMSAWLWVNDVAKALGDAVATPRGAAPDRAVQRARLGREHF